MLSVAFSAAMLGIEGYVVRVEADSAAGSPHFAIIGLPDRALGEARERVRAAILNSGFAYPAGRLLVNLSPADVRKAGPAFDLAIALALIGIDEQVERAALREFIALGELAFDGKLQPVSGILPMVLGARNAGFVKAHRSGVQRRRSRTRCRHRTLRRRFAAFGRRGAGRPRREVAAPNRRSRTRSRRRVRARRPARRSRSDRAKTRARNRRRRRSQSSARRAAGLRQDDARAPAAVDSSGDVAARGARSDEDLQRRGLARSEARASSARGRFAFRITRSARRHSSAAARS